MPVETQTPHNTDVSTQRLRQAENMNSLLRSLCTSLASERGSHSRGQLTGLATSSNTYLTQKHQHTQSEAKQVTHKMNCHLTR